MNVVLRGDVHEIRIGQRTNVQDGSVVHVMHRTHPARIGDDVTIGTARSCTGARSRIGADRDGRHCAQRRGDR